MPAVPPVSIPPIPSPAGTPSAAPAGIPAGPVPRHEPHGRVELPTTRPDVAPATRQAAERAALAQRAIEQDTAARLGITIPEVGRTPLFATPADKQREAIEHPAPRGVATGPIRIPVGTPLLMRPQDELDTQGIVLAVDGATATIGRRTPEGEIKREQVPITSLFEHDPTLAPTSFRDATGGVWQVLTSGEELLDAVWTKGAKAEVKIIPASARHLEKALGGLYKATDESAAVSTTWGDVLGAAGVAQRGVQLVAPGGNDLAQLRRLLGDHAFVVDDSAKWNGGPGQLVATDSQPAAAEKVLHDAADTARWFQEHAGIRPWGDGTTDVVLTTASPDGIANASAGRSGNTAEVMEGPRDDRIRGAWLTSMSGKDGRLTRKYAALVHDNDLGVRSHEAGHAALNSLLGPQSALIREDTTPARALEYNAVHEAMADMFGTARAHTADLGVRHAATGNYLSSSLETLRTYLAGEDPDPHQGTQLLTKPMIDRVAATRGWDAVAEIAGAAEHRVAKEVVAHPEPPTFPQFAAALRDATAARYGADSPEVRGLDADWRKLGVLPQPRSSSRGSHVVAAQPAAGAEPASGAPASGSPPAPGSPPAT